MPTTPIYTERRPPTVFLSYASEDRDIARRLGAALPGYGLEVWYDESELGGGDAWDQKIRRQIRDCDYFMALISAQTEARHEGYFRREWRFAAERTLDMADDHLFLLPVVVDDTDQARARVPEKFLAVQWLRVPGGSPTPALEALCRRLASGDPAEAPTGKSTGSRSAESPSRPEPPAVVLPPFPREEPGQRTRFYLHVVGWGLQCAWRFFSRLPRWVRILVYCWLVITLLSKGCASSPKHPESAAMPAADAQKLKAEAQKLEAMAEQYREKRQGDVGKSGAQNADDVAHESDAKPGRTPLLVFPFAAPADDAAGAKLAESTFAQVYGRMSLSQGRKVELEPLPAHDLSLAMDRARELHSIYLLWGTVDGRADRPTLTVKLVSVQDGSVEWSKSYPAAGTDPVTIAADVDAHVQSLGDE